MLASEAESLTLRLSECVLVLPLKNATLKSEMIGIGAKMLTLLFSH